MKALDARTELGGQNVKAEPYFGVMAKPKSAVAASNAA